MGNLRQRDGRKYLEITKQNIISGSEVSPKNGKTKIFSAILNYNNLFFQQAKKKSVAGRGRGVKNTDSAGGKGKGPGKGKGRGKGKK